MKQPRSKPRLSPPPVLTATIVAAVTALALGGMVWLGRRIIRNSDLLSRAALTAPADVWRPLAVSGATYRWRDNRAIVRLVSHSRYLEPTLLDTHTGRSRAIPLSGTPLYTSGGDPAAFSPDGKWLLCENRIASPPRYFAVALDGSKKRRDWLVPSYGARGVCWFADSRRFASVFFDTSKSAYIARVFSLNTPVVSPPRRVPGIGGQGITLMGALGSGRFLARETQMSPPRRTVGYSPRTTETLIEFGVEPGAARPRAICIAAPPVPASLVRFTKGGRVSGPVSIHHRSLLVSPRGDRVLWVISTVGFTPPPVSGTAVGGRIYPALERILPRVFSSSSRLYNRYQLFTARLDGRGGVSYLGEINPPAPPRSGGVTFSYIGDWQWTPDGKKISFTCNGDLYAIPAGAP